MRFLFICLLAAFLDLPSEGAEKKPVSKVPPKAATKSDDSEDGAKKKPVSKVPPKAVTKSDDSEEGAKKKPVSKVPPKAATKSDDSDEGAKKKPVPKSPPKTAQRDSGGDGAKKKPTSKSEPKTAEKETVDDRTGGKPPPKSSSKPVARSGDSEPPAAIKSPADKVPVKGAKPRDDSGDTAARGKTEDNASLQPDEIEGFDDNSAGVQRLIRTALELTHRGLTYRFGSADPKEGGMDCSGTVYYALRQVGFDPPRDCSGMYLWAEEAGTLRKVSPTTLDDASLRGLRPGDLVFWEGTYGVLRTPPISHVMIYLGLEKATGAPVMVGASDGRSYRGKRRNGVSVFDFKLPKAGGTSKFVAYARVPGI